VNKWCVWDQTSLPTYIMHCPYQLNLKIYNTYIRKIYSILFHYIWPLKKLYSFATTISVALCLIFNDHLFKCDNFLTTFSLIFILGSYSLSFFFSLLFFTNKKRKKESCHQSFLKWLFKDYYSFIFSLSQGVYT